jgi:predicted O-methyltransferase YrrM
MTFKIKILLSSIIIFISMVSMGHLFAIYMSDTSTNIFIISFAVSLIIIINMYWKDRAAEIASKIYTETKQQKFITEISKLGIEMPLSWSDFSISPDAACALIQELYLKKPSTVIECGSGDSTIIIASCLRKIGNGQIISFEHDELWAKKSISLINSLNLQDICKVIYAPLSNIEVDDSNWSWYSNFENSIKSEKIDMLFIDGPPSQKKNNEAPRYPAVPLCYSRFNDGAIVILDDAKRKGEKSYLETWKKKYNLTGEIRLYYERGLGILRFKK